MASLNTHARTHARTHASRSPPLSGLAHVLGEHCAAPVPEGQQRWGGREEVEPRLPPVEVRHHRQRREHLLAVALLDPDDPRGLGRVECDDFERDAPPNIAVELAQGLPHHALKHRRVHRRAFPPRDVQPSLEVHVRRREGEGALAAIRLPYPAPPHG
eukprot:CAMPEP_0182909186 /NCGR_PEP_ID=MMETSP0034_2-20130328/35618_1 /TAXON_ID=156128 /ORGANISM="Nephroselmis pyriformis, Strain CCMP717" /LENGTH=157 /DNA_ID=CAMNT_0025045423 /DNA_START=80 /DNA_END=550 /DNA_ORIENTATION=-